MTKPKKLYLNEPAEYSFDLVGLVSGLKSYVLASRINKLLGLALSRTHELEVVAPAGLQHYPVYCYTDNTLLTTYHLVHHRAAPPFLPQYKTTDYLLCVSGEFKPADQAAFAAGFAAISGVLFATPIVTTMLKGKEWLMF